MMAIYHATLKVFSRSAGRSAIAAAAYRAGARLSDARTGTIHDYRRRRDVAAVDLFAPDESPTWANDPQHLWDRAEAAERRSNACVARELEVSLPVELTGQQRIELTHDLAQLLVARYGVAVMAAIHAPRAGLDPRNHHVHLLFSTRTLGPSGFGGKVRILDDRSTGAAEVRALRAEVAGRINAALEKAGAMPRVDHRTLALQARDAALRGDIDAVAALSREPTKHLGHAATAARRRGRPSSRVREHTDRLRANAALLREARCRAEALQRELQARRARSQRSATHHLPLSLGRRGKSVVVGSTYHPAINDEAARVYLEGLKETVERVCEATERAIMTEQELVALAQWAARTHENAAFLTRVRDADRALYDAKAQYLRARQQFGEASVHRGQVDKNLDAVEANRPPAYQVLSQRQWAEKRRTQRRLAQEAAAAEQAIWKQVREGGPLPVAVEIARYDLGVQWDALRNAEAESRQSPAPSPAADVERAPTRTRRGRSLTCRRP